jgi:hypothetical protein
VRVFHSREKQSVPQLRWAGVRRSTGDLVGTIESRVVPDRDWCALMIDAHAHNPAAPVVGGPVTMSAGGTPRDWGLYFCEYGLFAPPITPGEVDELSGANLCYKRAALETVRDLTDAGCWETKLHERWHEQGRIVWLSTATVSFENSMSVGQMIQQRFAYGRGYAAARFDARRRTRRLTYAAISPLLPLVLLARLARSLGGKGLMGRFWRSSHWILLCMSAWAAGEMLGYLFGDAGHIDNF